MEELGSAPVAPSTKDLIAQCGKAIGEVSRDETSDQNDPDRIWILRRIYKCFLYYHDLQGFAPSIYQGLADVTGASSTFANQATVTGQYDYSQNLFRGFARKLMAVLGNRMPNAIAVPDNADDDKSITAASTASNAAEYIRQHCELPMQMFYNLMWAWNAGTTFWHIDFIEDANEFGFKEVPEASEQQGALGNASYDCPQCAGSVPAVEGQPAPTECMQCHGPIGPQNYKPPVSVNLPNVTMKRVPASGLKITLHNASEVTVPLDSTSIDDCGWLKLDREWPKAKCLANPKWGEMLRKDANATSVPQAEVSGSSQYAAGVRSAFASPVGLVRSQRPNMWTVSDLWWTPAQYELVDDPTVRKTLKENFPKGLRITSVRDKIVDFQNEVLRERWQECKPEPSERIMVDPLGMDWLEVTDIYNNTLNQCSETIDRSNQPGFADPTKLDFDALQERRMLPGEYIPMLRPAGGRLEDAIYNPTPITFSEQIAPWVASVIDVAKQVTGLLDAIWGGGSDDEPTARQAEMKKNSALGQLGMIWTSVGKSLEKVYMKATRLLAENEEGVLAFTKKDQFGNFNTMSVVVDDLRNGKYHFEADEAIPMTWGQQRDLLMWMLDKPEELLQLWGMDDPLNIPEFKRLLGMPGERIPLEDERKAGMIVIGKLLEAAPTPGPATPDGTPGEDQASIQPQWEDDHAFLTKLAKAYMKANPELETDAPDGYKNLQLWGQAQENAANVPPPPPPIKSTVALSLKGADLGSPAVQAALQKTGIVDQGTQVESDTDKAIDMQQQQAATFGVQGAMPPPPPPGAQPAPPVQ